MNASWPGVPALPQTYIDNYGVEMTGQFLVQRPQDGVVGETPNLYPLASDYHLVCLQHDDSAAMIIDNKTYYQSTSANPQPGVSTCCLLILHAAQQCFARIYCMAVTSAKDRAVTQRCTNMAVVLCHTKPLWYGNVRTVCMYAQHEALLLPSDILHGDMRQHFAPWANSSSDSSPRLYD